MANNNTELTREQVEEMGSLVRTLIERIREALRVIGEAFREWVNSWRERECELWNLKRFSGGSALYHPKYWLTWSARRSLIRLE